MQILLVHGLARAPVSMFGVAAALRRAGHATRFFGYTSTFQSVAGIVDRLTARLESLGTEPVGLVGHSLGGLLLRMAIERTPRLKVNHLVMLGTPNQPPRLARWAWRLLPFRLFAVDCGRLLAGVRPYPPLPPPQVPYTIIAGTAGPRGKLSPFGMEPNDGIVAESETRISNHDRLIRVGGFHSVLMDDPQARVGVIRCFER